MENKSIIQVIINTPDVVTDKFGIATANRFFYFTDDEKFVSFVRSIPKNVLLTVGILDYRFNPDIKDVDLWK